MVHLTTSCRLCIALLYGSLLNAFAADPDGGSSSRRLTDSEIFDALPNDSPINDKVVTGAFDADSISAIANMISAQSGSSKSSTPSITLKLPDLLGDNDYLSYSFDCDKRITSDETSKSFYKCSDQQRRKLEEDDTTPLTKVFIAMNGPFVSGVIEHGASVRYEIRSHIERDDDGDMVNVSYSYAAAKSEDVSYQHVGLAAEEPTEVNPDRRTLIRKGSSVWQAPTIPIDANLPNTVEHTGSATSKRELNDDGSEIDLLIYFTKRGSCQWLNEAYPCTIDTAAMDLLETYVASWVQYMNDVVVTSEINNLTFKTVHVAIDPDYDEGTSVSTSTVLYDLTDMDDGKLDNAHELRNEYNADFVVGFVYIQFGSAGTAWVPSLQPDNTLGFSVTGGSYPFVRSLHVIPIFISLSVF